MHQSKIVAGVGVIALTMVVQAYAVMMEWDVPIAYNVYRAVEGPLGARDFVQIAQVAHPTGQFTDNASPVCTGNPCPKSPRYTYVVQAVAAGTYALSSSSNSVISGQILPGWLAVEVDFARLNHPIKVRWVGLPSDQVAGTDKITFHVATDAPSAVVGEWQVDSSLCTGGGTGTGECTVTIPSWISGWGPWDFRYQKRNGSGDVLASSRAFFLQQ